MMKLCNVSLQYLYDCVTVISAFYASAGHYPLEGFHVWPVWAVSVHAWAYTRSLCTQYLTNHLWEFHQIYKLCPGKTEMTWLLQRSKGHRWQRERIHYSGPWEEVATLTAGHRWCVPGTVWLHESGESGSQTVSGAKAVRFESLPGSLLATTHMAVRTPVMGRS